MKTERQVHLRKYINSYQGWCGRFKHGEHLTTDTAKVTCLSCMYAVKQHAIRMMSDAACDVFRWKNIMYREEQRRRG